VPETIVKIVIKTVLFGVLAALAAPGLTADATTQEKQAHAQQPAALVEGEVRKVDKETKKIMIRHGAIPNLEMPPMTMVFQVKDPAMLENVKAGDKVRFAADRVGGAYTVTQLEPSK
jgi:Cu/Ag efflux protein CusF